MSGVNSSEIRKVAQYVYLACDESVAADIAVKCKRIADAYDSSQELIAKQAERIEGQLKALGVAGKRIAQLESCKDVSDTLAKQRVELCKNKDAEINKLQAYNELLREALTEMVKGYCELVDSGDAGFWDPEKDDEVIKSRAALAATAKGKI